MNERAKAAIGPPTCVERYTLVYLTFAVDVTWTTDGLEIQVPRSKSYG